MKHLASFIIILILLSFKGLQAQTPDPKFDNYLASVRELLPVDGTLLYDCSVLSGYHYFTHGSNSVTLFNVENDEIPFLQAWRADIVEVGGYWWNTGFITPPNTSAIEEGDLLFWVFHARTNEVDELIGLARASFAAQLTEPPFTNIVQTFTYPQTGWTRFYVYTEASTDYEPGDLQGTMHFDFFQQIIEFGGFIALNLGQGIDPADLPANEAMIDSKFDENLALVRELLPVEGTLLFDCADLSRYRYYGQFPGNSFSMINTEDDDVPFTKAFRIQLNEFGQTREQLIWPSNADSIHKGDMVLFVFYARSVVHQQETGWAFSATSGMSTPHWYDLAALEMTSPPDEWKRYYFFGRAKIDHDVQKLFTAIFFRRFPKIIDVGGFIALNLGQGIQYADLPYNTITYVGQEQDAPWREAAQDRIEEHRMGDMTVTVVDQSGEPVVAAEISVDMKRHAFLFGTYPAWMFYFWDGPNWYIYREKLLELFNAATTPFFMGTDDWGWYAQPESRPRNIAMAEWLHQHNMSISGTTLIYPGWWQMPSFFFDLADDPEALHTALIHHLDTIVPVGRDAGVGSWDVINEHSIASEVMDILGDEVLIDWFEHTHFLHPEAELGINEWGILMGGGLEAQHTNLKYLINILQNANAPLHRLGFQSHFGSYLPSPDVIFEILEDFSVYDLNIHISEFDINMDDLHTQADYTRDFMTIIFSHPSVNRFTTWGFWEQTMYTPKGAMFRPDWTPKPNYNAYTDVVFNQWWTEEEGLTDELGEYFVRGFLGEYEITVVKDSLSLTLDTVLVKEGTTLTLILAETYNLDLDVNPAGTGVVAGAGEYIAGKQVSIAAIANEDWAFVNWTGDIDYLDDENLSVVTVTIQESDISLTANFEYQNATDVSTLAELRSMPAGETIYRYTGEAVIVAMDDFQNRKYIQDETAAIFINDQPGNIATDYELYDVITQVTGQIENVSNMLRFIPIVNSPFALGNTPVEPATFAINELAPGDQAKLVKLFNVTFQDIEAGQVFANGQSYTITDGINSLVVRTHFWDVDYIGMEIPHGALSITGVVTQFHDVMQITPRFAADIENYFEPGAHNLILNVDMAYATNFNPDNDLVYVTGTFAGFWPIPGTDTDNQLMTRVDETMIWTKTFYLEEGEYEYKYFLNDGWGGGEWDETINRTIYIDHNTIIHDTWGHFVLALNAQPTAGGAIMGGGIHPFAAIVPVEANPLPGWEFVNWTGDIEHVHDANSSGTTVTMPASDVSLTANFAGIDIPENLVLSDETIAGGDTECFDALQTITVSDFTVEAGGSATLIAGQSIHLLPGTTVEHGGFLLARIAQHEGDYCGIPRATKITEEPVVIKEDDVVSADFPYKIRENGFFKLYPNPTGGTFTLEMTGRDFEQNITVEVYGVIGGRLFSKQLQPQRLHTLSLEGQQPGIYIIRVMKGDKMGVERLIKM